MSSPGIKTGDEKKKVSPSAAYKTSADNDHVILKTQLSVQGLNSEVAAGRSWLTIEMFVFTFCMVALGRMTQDVYHSGVIRTIERRFGLSSTRTGLIDSVDDAIQAPLLILFGYFGRKRNKPKLIAATSIFVSFGGIFMVLPYIWTLFAGSTELSETQTNHSHTGQLSEHSLCTEGFRDQTCQKDMQAEIEQDKFVLIMYSLANFCWGIGTSTIYPLGISYITENTTTEKGMIYIAFFMASLTIGPVCGLVLAAVATRLPENMISDDMSPDDPAFIGCWWLGYVVTSIFVFIFVLPIFAFPKQIKKDDSSADKTKTKHDEDSPILQQLKEFPREVLSLITNGRYMILIVADLCQAFVILSIIFQAPRYIETYFGYPAYKANILSVLTLPLCGVLGTLFGAFMTSRCKFTLKDSGRLMTICSVAVALAVSGLINVSCPPVNWASDTPVVQYDPSMTCNNNCSCTVARDKYHPVCAEDRTYFSPCHAGCSTSYNNTYTDCACSDDKEVASGICSTSCQAIYYYGALLAITSFMRTISRPTESMSVINAVPEGEASFALGLDSVLYNLLGFLPGSIIVGKVVDSACILWEYQCDSRTSCLLYNLDEFRLRTHGLGLGFAMATALLHAIYYCMVRSHQKCPEGGQIKNTKMTERIVTIQSIDQNESEKTKGSN